MQQLNPDQSRALLPTADLLQHLYAYLEHTPAATAIDTYMLDSQLALDTATVIPIKTAAISMLAVGLLHPSEPEHVAIYGTGNQAQAHIRALLDLYPNIIIDVIASNPGKALKFVQDYRDRRVRCTRIVFPEVDLLITATNSKRSVYSLQADPAKMIIGVGSQDLEHAEIGRNTINKSTIYTDDMEQAQLRAGDLNKAEIDWNQVQEIGKSSAPDNKTPILFKNMGASRWDQAIIDCALDIKQKV